MPNRSSLLYLEVKSLLLSLEGSGLVTPFTFKGLDLALDFIDSEAQRVAFLAAAVERMRSDLASVQR